MLAWVSDMKQFKLCYFIVPEIRDFNPKHHSSPISCIQFKKAISDYVYFFHVKCLENTAGFQTLHSLADTTSFKW